MHAPAYDNSLVKGKITDSIICQNHTGHNYALYLPTYYSSGKKFPCIFFFDAHARGALPLRLYKDLAEKHGFVLIGSNISKNGVPLQETNETVKVLMEDTRARINIDPVRIYTSGFSGGSRVAASIAVMNGGVAGVIGCAAGFPAVQDAFQNKFDYFGIVGDNDFNLTDMEKLNESLQQNGFAHQLLTFNGKHDWAPSSEFQTALLWMQVNAMKEKLQPANDTLVTALKNDYDKRISAAVSSGDFTRVHDLLDGMIKVLDGLSDVSAYKKQLADLVAGADFKNAVAMQAKMQQYELIRQQELAKQFTQQDEKWWTKKIAELNHGIHSAKTQKESQMYRRLINFLGLVGYLNVNHALSIDDLANAATYLKIFKMADHQNSDCSYLTAVYYIKKGNRQQAISSLNEAASSGFSDVSQLVTDPAFTGLQGEAVFKSIVTKVTENRSR